MRTPPTFLYPTARDHAFDEVCEKIVRALEKRHFDVPGIEVEFDTYGSGEQWMRLVRRVTGATFSLRFSRSQGLLPEGHYNDTAAVSSVAIPKEQVSVYCDHSGPSYYAYVGDDWDRDRDRFFTSNCFMNSKLNGEPRTYLKYNGSDETRRWVRHGHREFSGYDAAATYLLHDNDLGREYGLEDGNERFYKTSEVFDRMASHLETELAVIERNPERKGVYRFEETPDIPVEGCPEFWTRVEYRTVKRIENGQRKNNELRLDERYAIKPGRRLLNLGVSAGGIDVDRDVLHSGYVWSSGDAEVVPRECMSSFGDTYLVRISPNRANDIYVIDEYAYDRCRSELTLVLDEGDRNRFTNDEVNEMFRARAKTLTPLNEYQGDFEKPIFIIGRELGFDEVQVVVQER